MWGLNLWQEILLWVVIGLDLYIFVKLSKLRIGRFPLIKLRYRVLIAVLFPLLFILAFLLVGVLAALALTLLFFIFLFSLFGRKRKFKIML